MAWPEFLDSIALPFGIFIYSTSGDCILEIRWIDGESNPVVDKAFEQSGVSIMT